MDIIRYTLSNDKKSVLLYLGLAALTKRLVATWTKKNKGGFSIQETEVTQIGLKEEGGMFDRHFAVVSRNESAALTAKFTPILATVKTEVNDRSLKFWSPKHLKLGVVTPNCDTIEKVFDDVYGYCNR
ncbi:hypothetical protein CAPTEDRAFT_199157 [Capitella teleta]|uniref:Molybdenum cofactor sulfurase middle domain-containing protein n=1 Tax=Capitella teleta TaxID=283909 RepID=R7VD06_CAPTE|nr:hypothetical protein CAPTEDRAFT_199157 [Capitella teleta]|eukprot:ELU16693.1 hypothetical protein CAPTEDRAFT_199157 [Capitella teleta]